MRKFIVRVLCFLLPLLGILVILEGYARSLPSSYKQKDSWMQENAHEVEVLVLGNSHGLFGLRPQVFPKKTYNLCQVSQIFEYDEYLLLHYAPLFTKLSDVILIVDNSNLFDAPLELTESYRCAYYRLYMDYPKHSYCSKYGFELSNVTALYNKMKAKSFCDSLGWNGSYTKDQRPDDYLSEENVSEAALRHQCKNWQYADDNRSALNRIAEWCNQHHVRLILLQAPVSRAYYDKIGQRQLDYIKTACHIPGVLDLDYATDKRFSDEDFFDPDHLTTEGAEKWSKIISDSLF